MYAQGNDNYRRRREIGRTGLLRIGIDRYTFEISMNRKYAF